MELEKMAFEMEISTQPVCPRCRNNHYGLDDWWHGLSKEGRMSHQCGFCRVFFSVQVRGSEVTSRLNRSGDDTTLDYYKQQQRFTGHVIAGLLH